MIPNSDPRDRLGVQEKSFTLVSVLHEAKIKSFVM